MQMAPTMGLLTKHMYENSLEPLVHCLTLPNWFTPPLCLSMALLLCNPNSQAVHINPRLTFQMLQGQNFCFLNGEKPKIEKNYTLFTWMGFC